MENISPDARTLPSANLVKIRNPTENTSLLSFTGIPQKINEDDMNKEYASFEKTLWIKILIGMFVGIVIGIMLSPHGYSLV